MAINPMRINDIRMKFTHQTSCSDPCFEKRYLITNLAVKVIYRNARILQEFFVLIAVSQIIFVCYNNGDLMPQPYLFGNKRKD